MKSYQHIYVYKSCLKHFNILKTMNKTVILIFVSNCTYLLIYYDILSKGKLYRARCTDMNPYARSPHRYLFFLVVFIFWRQLADPPNQPAVHKLAPGTTK